MNAQRSEPFSHMRTSSITAALAILLSCPVLFGQADLCDEALLVSPGIYTADGPATGSGASQPDAVNADWYAYTPPVEGFLSVWSCGSQVDTRVHIHSGTCGSLTLLGSDDDGCPDGYPPGSSLLANVPVEAGVTYYIEWDDRYTTDGFTWTMDLHACPIAMPTITPGFNSFTLDWPVLAAGAPFIVEYGPPGFAQGTGTTVSGVQGDTQPPITIDSLLGNAAFDVYMNVNCGGGNVAPFTGPWHATSLGAAENDDCEGAQPITCGTTTFGTTVGVAEDAVPECGTSISAPGVWYSFTAGPGTVVLSTCADHSYDTKINVYTGPCDDLQCVGGNDDGPAGCGYGSEVIMQAEEGVTYLVLVQGYNGATGTFGLSLDCPTCQPPEGLVVTTADTQALLYWTSANAGAQFSVEYGPAGFTPGTGTVITGIYGVDGPPATMTGLQADTDYEVYLSETCTDGGVSLRRGPVAFTTLVDPVATNAFCSGAVTIACDGSVEGNTSQGLYTPGPWCGSANITSPGLWYTFVGDGNDATLSTCGTAAYDSKISIFSGPCADLVCAGGNDDAAGCNGNSSRITVATLAGVEYLALVHGYQDAAGAFTLSMTCAAPCAPAVPNDDCVNAQPLIPQAMGSCEAVEGTNVCAYVSSGPNPGCDPYTLIQDVWYSMATGPSTTHTITLSAATAGALDMALYSGCGSGFIECYDPTQGPVVLTGLLTDTTYYIQVWNTGGDNAGTFTICDEAPLLVGMNDEVQGGLRAWPVPASAFINVEGLAPGASLIRLMDASGREISAQRVTGQGTQQIDLKGVKTGVYVLVVEAPSMKQVLRVVVE